MIKVVKYVTSDIRAWSRRGHEFEESGAEVSHVICGQMGREIQEAAIAVEKMLQFVSWKPACRNLFRVSIVGSLEGEEDFVTGLLVNVTNGIKVSVSKWQRDWPIIELARKRSHDNE